MKKLVKKRISSDWKSKTMYVIKYSSKNHMIRDFLYKKKRKKKKESLPGSLKMGRNQKMVNYTIFLNVFHLNLMRRGIKRGK